MKFIGFFERDPKDADEVVERFRRTMAEREAGKREDFPKARALGKLRFLLAIMLTVLLAVASAQNVFAAIEISYDDGTASNIFGGTFAGVRFTSSGQVKVVGARFYLFTTTALTRTAYITGPDHTTVLLSFPVSFSFTGWTTVTISNGPVVSGDFFIVIDLLVGGMCGDATNNSGRSYWGGSLAALTQTSTQGDIMIRALVEGSGAVGGVVLPTSSLTVLAPYLAMIGLVATAAVAVKKRRN